MGVAREVVHVLQAFFICRLSSTPAFAFNWSNAAHRFAVPAPLSLRTANLHIGNTDHAFSRIRVSRDVPSKESARPDGTSQMRKRSPRGIVCAGCVGLLIHDIDRTRGDG